MTRVRRRIEPAFALVLLAFVLYAAGFIWKTSFVVGGERYFTLHDDAMISMRYARNLAAGAGLVWNPGEAPVEGYTNPLWVLFMALVHLAPLEASKTSLVVQVASALFLVANLFVVRWIAEELAPDVYGVALPAVVLTAFYLPLATWSLEGMEVGLLTLLVSASLLAGLRALRAGTFPLASYVGLGLGTLVRIDMAVPFGMFLLFFLARDRRQWKRHLRDGAGVLLLCLGAQTVLRIAYYGDVLPNTYYLKMTGFPLIYRLSRGAWVLAGFLFRSNWVLVLLVPSACLLRPTPPVLLTGWCLLGQLLYSVWVGGDAWENWGGSNRYVTIAMPAFFVLFSLATALLIDGIRRFAKASTERRGAAWVLAHAVFILGALLSFNAFRGKSTLREWLLLDEPLLVSDNRRMVETAQVLRATTPPDARIAVVWAGIIPYFADRPSIDLLGKNDRRIARLEARMPPGVSRWTAFYPGHMKYDYRYSIGELAPDVVVQLWEDTSEAMPILERDYSESHEGSQTLWYRNGMRRESARGARSRP